MAGAPHEVVLPPLRAPLPEVPTAASSGGALDTALVLGGVHLVGQGVQLATRAYNGSIPGPTLAVYPGERLSILLSNQLEPPVGKEAVNTYHHPNMTNLHVHGLHVSPRAPSDDVLGVHVEPKSSFRYEYTLRADHSPGTYWAHPHNHGSVTLQAGGGAASALIVRDPPGFLSEQLAALRDRVLMLQDLNRKILQKAAAVSGDTLLDAASWRSAEDLILVNGAVEPVLVMQPGEWQRIRLVMAGISAWMHVSFGACDVMLLAKDGIYISDFPRPISRVSLPPGGRADLVLRCPAAKDGEPAAEHEVRSVPQPGGHGTKPLAGPMFLIRVEGSPAEGLVSQELQAWAPPVRPAYLQDLLSTESPDCSCSTSMGLGGNNRWINGHLYGGQRDIVHHSPRDAVVERHIYGLANHSYHQHTWPYQLMRSPAGNDSFYKAGDWHDSYQNILDSEMVVRFHTVDYTGPLVVHCHALAHSDTGMLAVEKVGGLGQGYCGCDLLNQASSQEFSTLGDEQGQAIVVGAAVAFLAMLGLAAGGLVRLGRACKAAEEKARNYRTLSDGPRV